MHQRFSPHRNSDQGSVLLETAIAVPVLIAVTVALVWVVSLGATYVRVLDAAQTAARQAARGASTPSVEGMRIRVDIADGMAMASAEQQIATPVSPLLGGHVLTVHAEAAAMMEDGVAPESAP